MVLLSGEVETANLAEVAFRFGGLFRMVLLSGKLKQQGEEALHHRSQFRRVPDGFAIRGS